MRKVKKTVKILAADKSNSKVGVTFETNRYPLKYKMQEGANAKVIDTKHSCLPKRDFAGK